MLHTYHADALPTELLRQFSWLGQIKANYTADMHMYRDCNSTFSLLKYNYIFELIDFLNVQKIVFIKCLKIVTGGNCSPANLMHSIC